MRRALLLTLFLAWGAMALAQSAPAAPKTDVKLPPVVGGGKATLKDIVGTETMVTLKLKDRGAEDANARIVSLSGDYLTVVGSDKAENFYRLSDIEEIRVQGGEVTTKPFVLDQSRGVTSDQQQIVNRALQRLAEIYAGADQNIPVKMEAAGLLLAANAPQAEEVRKFLTEYVSSNDLANALLAAEQLLMAGDPEPARSLLNAGIRNENWRVRAATARLAGLCGEKTPDILRALHDLIRDRAADVSAPALTALARLGQRDIIPEAIRMLAMTDTKADAAVFALIRLGGEDVTKAAKNALKDSQGMTRFRILRVLHSLGDAEATEILRTESLEVPTIRIETALLLAKDGDVKAMQVLRERLGRRFDPDDDTLTLRAEMATALLQAGDRAEIGVLQELLRMDNRKIERRVCELITTIGMRFLIAVIQPSIESTPASDMSLEQRDQVTGVALEASRTAIALANTNYRTRYLDAQG